MNTFVDKHKIVIIIINYNSSHLIQGLIDSINENDVEISILILDNASLTPSYNELKNIKDSRVQILRSEINLGFTGGINFALKYLQTTLKEIKYFFLLNPDAFSCPNLIGELKGILDANKNAACVSPKISLTNGEPWYSGAKFDFAKGNVVNNPATESSNEAYYEVDVFSGCAVLFDFEKVINAGLFNEKLFMYYDEADFSLKLKKFGYKILYTPRLEIFHDVSFTTKNTSFIKTYYMTRNRFFVFNDYMKGYYKIYILLYNIAFHLKNKRIKNAYYHVKGFIDFKINRFGRL